MGYCFPVALRPGGGAPDLDELWRDLNRRLGTQFPVDGPRTLNGLLLDVLQELPEAPVSVRFGNLVVEIQQIEDRVIRSARLRRLPH